MIAKQHGLYYNSIGFIRVKEAVSITATETSGNRIYHNNTYHNNIHYNNIHHNNIHRNNMIAAIHDCSNTWLQQYMTAAIHDCNDT